jgi:ABC-type transporter Mla MlaB component
MNFQLNASDKTGQLVLNEPLTLDNIFLAKELFMEAFEKADLVNIQFKSIEKIDLSGIQLFCSAFRTFSETNKTLTIDNANHAFILQKKARKIGLNFNIDHP